MEKEIGRIKKNDTTDIIVRVDEYKGKKGLTIREFVTSDRYTGFTKAGTRIGPENFFQFREMINSIDSNEFMSPVESKPAEDKPISERPKKERKPRKKKEAIEEEPSEEPTQEVAEKTEEALE